MAGCSISFEQAIATFESVHELSLEFCAVPVKAVWIVHEDDEGPTDKEANEDWEIEDLGEVMVDHLDGVKHLPFQIVSFVNSHNSLTRSLLKCCICVGGSGEAG